MKILLTGSNGFLGSNIFKNLVIHNDIYTLSRSNSDYNYNLVTDVPIFDQSFDLIIHAAGKAHSIPKNNYEKNEFFNVNVKGTFNLLAGLSNVEYPKKFIFISSVSVYGLTSGIHINEDAELLAEDPYGKSKIVAEEIVKKWCDEHNIICTILRLPLVVGLGAPGNLAFMVRGISKRYYFNIAGGRAKKSMVLVTDIVKYILKISEVGGIYNLTDGIHPSFKELSTYIAKNMGRTYVPNLSYFMANLLAIIGNIIGDSFPINSNKLSKITSTLTFDDSKARKHFNWDPSPVLENISSII